MSEYVLPAGTGQTNTALNTLRGPECVMQQVRPNLSWHTSSHRLSPHLLLRGCSQSEMWVKYSPPRVIRAPRLTVLYISLPIPLINIVSRLPQTLSRKHPISFRCRIFETCSLSFERDTDAADVFEVASTFSRSS